MNYETCGELIHNS